ncbi:hypothetical protein BN938_0151 [Mucinivorans hirudinis]|uniref:Uncharacterized protein n=1 Tax=Mucinivorans hirudinis TaxID=1433126 RepID=A0A060R5Y1_9BACT|nr:hypothetical protein BN938_0151 [Mucinivorans hirudinis]
MKAEWYFPANISLDSPRVLISILRTFFMISSSIVVIRDLCFVICDL